MFAQIFQVGIDTMLMCFLIDKKMNGDGNMRAALSLKAVIGRTRTKKKAGEEYEGFEDDDEEGSDDDGVGTDGSSVADAGKEDVESGNGRVESGSEREESGGSGSGSDSDVDRK